jgi:hypothetical protein
MYLSTRTQRCLFVCVRTGTLVGITRTTKSHKSIVSRLGMIAEPSQAIHDTAQLGLGADDHEAALVVASNLSMLCLKRLEDCLEDLGDYKRGSSDAWLAGEV